MAENEVNKFDEFTAKLLADFAKIILIAGFASEFFGTLHPILRISIWIVFAGLVILSLLIHPKKKG